MLKRLLGLLGWLGVIFVLAAFAIRMLRPEWDWYSYLAIAGLVCTLLYTLSQWRDITRSFSGREARFGSLAVASIAVVLAILIGINYLAARRNTRWDLTAARQFTLSDQTKRVLSELQRPVTARVFDRAENFERFRPRLDEYRYLSDQLTVEYIDVERRPAEAIKYQVQTAGTVAFEYDGRVERVTSEAEQELTNGLIKVIQGRETKVYFVEGHGERTTDPAAREGYSAIASALTSDNFAHAPLVLAQQGDVPADATVLIIAGPTSDFLAPEIGILEAYLARGGKLFVLLDPPDKPGDPDLTNLVGLVRQWGMDPGLNVVVDASGVGQMIGTGPEVPIAAKYNPHPITEGFKVLTAYPFARSITSNPAGANNRFAQNLIETSESSWAETDIKELMTSGKVQRDTDKGDLAGPVSLGAAVSAPAEKPPAQADGDAPKPETRLVVIGDSDFASNRWLGISGNRDLFLNAVNWLAQQENLIAIRAKDPEDRRITLTADQDTRIRLLTIFIIPGLILLAGVQAWWRRR